jgi:hypothetical protein
MFQKDHSAFIFRIKLFIIVLLDPDGKNTVILLIDGTYVLIEKV